MGLFCVNMHLRATDAGHLADALVQHGVTRYHVEPEKNGWISLYEEQASQQDDGRIRDLLGGISKNLQVVAIAFLVHDSDVACYWLYDKGRLLDEYNSCPDYFDGDDSVDDDLTPASSNASGGKPDVLLNYCRKGVSREELEEIFAEESVFAENKIERLATAFGIDPGRALADYRDIARGDGPGHKGDPDDDDDDDDGGILKFRPQQKGFADQLTKMFGGGGDSDPQAQALVQAAANDDGNEIDRLLTAGVAVDVEAAAPLPNAQGMAGLGQMFPRGMPKIVMTPLLAAVVNKRQQAAERLLKAGADPNRLHELFGAPIHAAVGAGDVGLLKLLLSHGADVNSRNARGQTPLVVIAAGRAAQASILQVQTMMKTMGMKLPGLTDQMVNLKMPIEGWDACERLLKEHGAE